MLTVLKRGLTTREKIQLMYVDRKGTISQRFVTVLAVTETHLVCYCHYRKQRRLFKLVNILAASAVKGSRLRNVQ